MHKFSCWHFKNELEKTHTHTNHKPFSQKQQMWLDWFFPLCLFICVCVCAILLACLRSLLACILCCDCLDPLHPQDLDPPLPPYPCSTRPSLTPLQGEVERPQTTLPLSPLGHWAVAVRDPQGAESLGDRGSVAGLSCSTLAPSELMDMRQLLRIPRRQHRLLDTFCPCVVACLRRLNLNR